MGGKWKRSKWIWKKGRCWEEWSGGGKLLGCNTREKEMGAQTQRHMPLSQYSGVGQIKLVTSTTRSRPVKAIYGVCLSKAAPGRVAGKGRFRMKSKRVAMAGPRAAREHPLLVVRDKAHSPSLTHVDLTQAHPSVGLPCPPAREADGLDDGQDELCSEDEEEHHEVKGAVGSARERARWGGSTESTGP